MIEEMKSRNVQQEEIELDERGKQRRMIQNIREQAVRITNIRDEEEADGRAGSQKLSSFPGRT